MSQLRLILGLCAVVSLAACSDRSEPTAANAPSGVEATQASTSIERGQRVFLRCTSCHAITATGVQKIGPHLDGVVGRKAGSVEGVNYSPAMKASGLTWDEATLDRWLMNPQQVVPETSMAFAGLPNEADRKALIDYLKSTGG